jgi:hypothetical protein
MISLQVPVMNALAPDVSLCGNHDFDFGYPHLTKLIKDTEFVSSVSPSCFHPLCHCLMELHADHTC